jgi:putative flippase GtrA
MRLAVSLSRHPASSLAATAVDFTAMVVVASVVGLPASLGTTVGAALGAAVNFLLGRSWVFRATGASFGPQAGRYAFVSLGSLVLNATGVHLLAVQHHLPYVAARVLVSVFVSFAWNFLLQRFFVFGEPGP